jgi:hypothetical protein
MNDEFENALSWFCSAPLGWIESGKKNLAAAAEWLWEVLQGDFNDNQTTAQVATGTVISMIPFVDQLCDVRDVVSNCNKIKEVACCRFHRHHVKVENGVRRNQWQKEGSSAGSSS